MLVTTRSFSVFAGTNVTIATTPTMAIAKLTTNSTSKASGIAASKPKATMRAEHRARSVERAVDAEGRRETTAGTALRDQGVAWRRPYALTDPVDHDDRRDGAPCCTRHQNEQAARRRQSVAERCDRLVALRAVRQDPRRHSDQRGRTLIQPVDEAEGERRHPEVQHEIERQDARHHLRRHVRQEAGEPEGPHRAAHRRQATLANALSGRHLHVRTGGTRPAISVRARQQAGPVDRSHDRQESKPVAVLQRVERADFSHPSRVRRRRTREKSDAVRTCCLADRDGRRMMQGSRRR